MDRQREYGEVLPASSTQRKPPKRTPGSRPSISCPGPHVPYQRPRRGRVSRIVLGVAFIVLVLALLALGAIVFSYWQGQQSYDEVAHEVFPTADDAFAREVDLETVGNSIDWAALEAINPDTVGWLYIPGTPVNYPVVQTSNNVTYLSTDFQGNQGWLAQFGCIFAAAENTPGFADENNVLFGHHMNDGSMFGFIEGLYDPAKFNATRNIYLLTPDGNYRLQTFSILTCNENEAIAQTSFATAAEYTAYVQDVANRSEVVPDPAVDLSSVSKTFMFATCDNAVKNLRQVLFAAVVESTAPADASIVNDAQAAVDAARGLTTS